MNYNHTSSPPNKYVSRKQKETLKYTKTMLDYCESRLRKQSAYSSNHDLSRLYELAAGVFNLSDYKHVLDPFDEKEERAYAEKLRNWDFISPLFSQLVGEFIQRPIEPTVINLASDIDNVKNQLETDRIYKSLQQVFVNVLIQNGLYVEGEVDQNGQPIAEPEHPDMIKKDISSISDEKSMMGQAALNNIMFDQDVAFKLITAAYDFFVSNSTFTYKDVVNDNVVYNVISPFDIRFLDSPNISFIEDSDIVCYTGYATRDELYEMFQDEDGYETIHNALCNNSYSNEFHDQFMRNFHNRDITSYENQELIQYRHYQYTDMVKVYRIYTYDLAGQPIFYDVDEDYLPNSAEQLESRWIRQTYEGFVIGGEHYIKVRPIDHQRAKFSDPSNCKKSYNGVIFKKQHPEIKTIADKLITYQETYNIAKFRLHATINKYKGGLALLPIGLFKFWQKTKKRVEDDEGTDAYEEAYDENIDQIAKGMYYAEATNILFVDEEMENLPAIINMIKVLDFGLGTFIRDMLEVCANIKAEAEELVGFNRFRKANITASDAVTNVNSGQYAGSLITEEYFTTFNKFIEKECQGLVDIAKFAYRNGKRQSYIRTDGQVEMLKVEPGSITETEFGVFVKNGGKTKEKLQTIHQLGLTLAQNGMKGSIVAEAINADSNIEKIIEKMKIAEKEFEEAQQRQQEAENQINMQRNEIMQKQSDDQLAMRKYEVDTNNQTKIDLKVMELSQQAIALRDSESLKQIGLLMEDSRMIDSENFNRRVKEIELALHAQEIAVKDKEIDTKKEISDTQLTIAKTNKN